MINTYTQTHTSTPPNTNGRNKKLNTKQSSQIMGEEFLSARFIDFSLRTNFYPLISSPIAFRQDCVNPWLLYYAASFPPSFSECVLPPLLQATLYTSA